MLRLKINVRTGATQAYLAALEGRIRDGAKEVSRKYAGEIQKTARDMMEEGKSGIHYKGMPRRSSAPGESPASQTGKMAGSIRIWGNGTAYFRVGSPLWYANFIQQHRDRPLMEPALEKVRPAFYKAIEDMIDRSVR